MSEENVIRETEEPIIVYVHYDGFEFDYAVKDHKYKELVQEFLVINGAKIDHDEEGFYFELYRVYTYLSSKKFIDITKFFCNASVIWMKSYDDFLEVCD